VYITWAAKNWVNNAEACETNKWTASFSGSVTVSLYIAQEACRKKDGLHINRPEKNARDKNHCGEQNKSQRKNACFSDLSGKS